MAFMNTWLTDLFEPQGRNNPGTHVVKAHLKLTGKAIIDLVRDGED
jgi:hypothetical protein